MAEIIAMPKLGFDMAEGTLNRWILAEGDAAKKGDVIAEIETDKATVEVEASSDGVILKHLVSEGTSVPIGDPIAVFGAEGEDVDLENLLPANGKEPAPTPVEEKAAEPAAVEVAPAQGSEPTGDAHFPAGVRISPLARRMAEEHQLNLQSIKGSGPLDRIVKRDIEAALATTKSEPTILSFAPRQDERIALSKLRGAIGRRMTASKQQLPHFYVTIDMDAAPLMQQRREINALLPEEDQLSVNDFIVKATALTLVEHPNFNSSLDGDNLIRHGSINVGIAVAVEDGLLTVVTRDTDRKPIRVLGRETREMIDRARDGRVRPEDVEGSTFTISNLGMYGVEDFCAIINPPESGILAVGGIRDEPVVVDGAIVPGKRIKVTLSADHRVVDGVQAAQWLRTFKEMVEKPLQLLL